MLVLAGEQVREEHPRSPEPGEMVWIHLDDASESRLHAILLDMYNLHPLAVEDAVHGKQRPKVDTYLEWTRPHGLVSFYAVDNELDPLEISVFLGTNFVITVCADPIPWLDQLYIRARDGHVRFQTPTTLLHRIVDGCADSYTDLIDDLEDRLDHMQRNVFHHPEQDIGGMVFRFKRKLLVLRKVAFEERTVLGTLKHDSFPLIDSLYRPYFEDVYDHVARAMDNLELLRDSFSGLLEFQASMRAQDMNQVMKTLTIISTIFLPLSFITGVYGTNFKIIPELNWPFGYAYLWGLLVTVAVVFLIYFKRKGWW